MDSDKGQARRIEDAALKFAEQALAQPAQTQSEQAQRVAHFMVAFHEYAKQRAGEREGEYAQLLRRITDPKEALPRIVEKVGQALQLLRTDKGEPGSETIFFARDQLADAMRLLGRQELIP